MLKTRIQRVSLVVVCAGIVIATIGIALGVERYGSVSAAMALSWPLESFWQAATRLGTALFGLGVIGIVLGEQIRKLIAWIRAGQ